MNKKLAILFFGIFSMIMIFSHESTYAQTVYLNDGKIVDGRTLLPLRAIFEELNADVKWEQKTKTVYATKGTDKIKLTIGSKRAMVNGKNVIVDVAPTVISSRTYVPLRFISEALGANVSWDQQSRVATVVSGEKTIKVNTIHWKTYQNGRFGFAINYPSHWGLYPPPTNGDGIIFNSGIKGADFRVYASYNVLPDYFKEDYGWYYSPEGNYGYQKEVKRVNITGGKTATVLVDKSGNSNTYHMILLESDVIYNFYATTPKNFDENMIWKMIQSYRTFGS